MVAYNRAVDEAVQIRYNSIADPSFLDIEEREKMKKEKLPYRQ